MRRLTPGAEVPDTVAAVLDQRLLKSASQPLAVAVSGGGDSVALLLAAHAWAHARGRRLLVLTVDHGLQPQSRAWTERCAALSARLGHPFQALSWIGDKPERGLAAAARQARHALLADAAREAGASVILLGHTADDVAEAGAMRAAGATTPDPREWTPSPSWPQGRGVFLLRPLLALRRDALRTWLTGRGEDWIDDPANADLRSARSRARAAGPPVAPPPPSQPPLMLADAVVELAGGALLLPSGGSAPEFARLVSLAAVCAGGGDRLPARASAEGLARRLAGGEPVQASLAGARVVRLPDGVLVVRETGEAARGGLAPLSLAPGQTEVWDGRMEIRAGSGHVVIRALAGHAGKLAEAQRRALATVPAPARPALPAVVEQGRVSSPALGGLEAFAQSLTLARLRSAAGLVVREPLVG